MSAAAGLAATMRVARSPTMLSAAICAPYFSPLGEMAPSRIPEGTRASAMFRALVSSVPTRSMPVIIATTLRRGSSRSMAAWHDTQCAW
ncbi:MAG TPA: hypothetical protein VF815_02305 [Myxococcaceae bacterium]